MAVILDIEMPTRCEDCPCAWFDQEGYYDPTCQAATQCEHSQSFKILKEDYRYGLEETIPKPDWCPLREYHPESERT